ncbi:MAG: ribulokinase [Fimbriimonadales bacterium]
MPRCALGIDYGTNSVRALLVDVDSGEEVATHVSNYLSGQDGILLDPKDPDLARQNPQDYIDGFHDAVLGAMARANISADDIVGIGVDTTGSTPIPVDKRCVPLAMKPEFRDELAAQAWLWKDHTSFAEAGEITAKARENREPYLAKCGGTYSSEWFFSKILHCERVAPKVFKAAHTWLECADYVPAFLTGQTDPKKVARSACAAGHKAMHNRAWGGLPSKEFLAKLSPGIAALHDRLYTDVQASDKIAGYLTEEIAKATGLKAGIPVAVGAFDAHMGAVGSGIKAGTLVKIMGTSTCDIMVAPRDRDLPDVPGLCGIADDTVLPGMYGLEAGQSAVGDLFNWFVKHLCPPEFVRGMGGSPVGPVAGPDPHERLSAAGANLRPGQSGLVALDWNNGNRTILVDPQLSGLLIGQTLHTTAPEVYRALIEATAFGALRIIERLEEYGINVEEIVTCGGIAEKSPFTMQIYADICNRPMKISRSAQTCALGAAIFGAVAGGAFPDVPSAQAKMTGVKDTVYIPSPDHRAIYGELYGIYRELHDAFGVGGSCELGSVMKRLRAIRSRAI